jgi:hypothetical protein
MILRRSRFEGLLCGRCLQRIETATLASRMTIFAIFLSYNDISIDDEQDNSQPGIEEKELMIGVPPQGDYTLQVTGTDTGTYVLEFLGRDTNGASSQTVFPPLPTAPGVVNMFTIRMNLASGVAPTFAGSFNGGGQRPRDVNQFLTYANPTARLPRLPVQPRFH